MNEPEFFEKARIDLLNSPKRCLLSMQIRHFLFEQGATACEQQMADVVTSKVFSQRCEVSKFVPNSWLLLKWTNYLFFSHLTSQEEFQGEANLCETSSLTEQIAVIATSRWIDSATRLQIDALSCTAEETAARLVAQYQQYMAFLQGNGMTAREAIAAARAADFCTIRSRWGEELLKPIVTHPNGLFSTKLSSKSVGPAEPKPVSDSGGSEILRAKMGLRPAMSWRFSRPFSRYNSARAAILGTPPLMRTMVSKSVQSRR